MSVLAIILSIYFGIIYGIEIAKPDESVAELKEKLTKAKELLKWALHSDPEHDDLVDFDTKWNEAKQFLEEEETNG